MPLPTTNKSAVSLVADDCFRANPRRPRESVAEADASSPPRWGPRRRSSARRCAAPPCLPPSVGIRIASTMSCSPAPSTSCAKAPTRSPARCSVPRRLSDGCHASSPGALGEPLRRPTAACYHVRYHPGSKATLSAALRAQKTPPEQGFSVTRQERFELPTFGSVDRRSIQLSYWRRAASLVGTGAERPAVDDGPRRALSVSEDPPAAGAVRQVKKTNGEGGTKIEPRSGLATHRRAACSALVERDTEQHSQLNAVSGMFCSAVCATLYRWLRLLSQCRCVSVATG